MNDDFCPLLIKRIGKLKGCLEAASFSGDTRCHGYRTTPMRQWHTPSMPLLQQTISHK